MTWQGKFETKALRSIILAGTTVGATEAGTTNSIKVLIYDDDGDILYAKGTDVPVDDTSGYAKGCLFIDTDVAADTNGLYMNIGDTDDCNFDVIPAT